MMGDELAACRRCSPVPSMRADCRAMKEAAINISRYIYVFLGRAERAHALLKKCRRRLLYFRLAIFRMSWFSRDISADGAAATSPMLMGIILFLSI